MSCVCARALRSIASRPARSSARRSTRAAQHLRPAEDRVERRAQLVRERGEKLVLHRARPLGLGAGGALAVEQLLALLGRFLRRGLAHAGGSVMSRKLHTRPTVAAVDDLHVARTARTRCRPRAPACRTLSGAAMARISSTRARNARRRSSNGDVALEQRPRCSPRSHDRRRECATSRSELLVEVRCTLPSLVGRRESPSVVDSSVARIIDSERARARSVLRLERLLGADQLLLGALAREQDAVARSAARPSAAGSSSSSGCSDH